MQRDKYQLYKHRRTSSLQRSQVKPHHLQSSHSKPAPYPITSSLLRKFSKNNQLIQQPTTSLFDIPPDTLPIVTCKSGCAYDLTKKQYIWKTNSVQKRQIASLTKIMTCWVVIEYLRERKIIPEDECLIVSKRAADIGGTSAELQEGDVVSIWDLLHGLMLPSGNDAAVCLAEGIGKYFGKQEGVGVKNAYDLFVGEMNRQATRFGMINTTYINPHGLSHRNHRSTCQDQILLLKKVLEERIFQALIDKKLHFANIEDKNGWSKEMFWETTNKLLHNEFSGIKTGSTQQAGPCLASWYRNDGLNVLIVTLSSSNADTRFKDAVKIVKWIKTNTNSK